MNKRIKELAEQAELNATLLFNKDKLEKFAELIVRECISALEEKIHRLIDHEGDEIWADLVLKEHFGVEE